MTVTILGKGCCISLLTVICRSRCCCFNRTRYFQCHQFHDGQYFRKRRSKGFRWTNWRIDADRRNIRRRYSSSSFRQIPEEKDLPGDLPGRDDPRNFRIVICRQDWTESREYIYFAAYFIIYNSILCNECRTNRVSICGGGQLSCSGVSFTRYAPVGRTVIGNDFRGPYEHQ